MNQLKADVQRMYPDCDADQIIATMQAINPIFSEMTHQQLMLLAIRAHNQLRPIWA